MFEVLSTLFYKLENQYLISIIIIITITSFVFKKDIQSKLNLFIAKMRENSIKDDPQIWFYPDIQLHSAWYTEATGKENFKLRATACFHGKPWFDAVRLEVEPTNKGKLLRLDRGSQFKVPQTIHGYAKVVGIFLHGIDDTGISDGNSSNSDTNEANEVTAHIFVRWLDGMYPGGKANASIFHSAAPVSHGIGHMKDCKAQGNESPYQIFSVDQKAILCPVWLLPDSDKEGEYMAIKNDDKGSWHQYQQSS